jgi:hypothetical protein
MLAINNAKHINTILIITTIIGLCSNVAAFIIMIIKQYVGFGVLNSSIVCSSSGYAAIKYVQSNNINGYNAG